ncbi:FAD-dependent oxidoreductase, partial [Klebsiella pneumoniae]|nr:FAD-dependent oxidoreductase [Klebsiella pneumoniae]
MTTSTGKAKKMITADMYECEATYDVVVYGGDPEAVAAAAAAARRGSRVALVNPDPELGKLITRGWLTYLDIPPVAGEVKKPEKLDTAAQGIFQE